MVVWLNVLLFIEKKLDHHDLQSERLWLLVWDHIPKFMYPLLPQKPMVSLMLLCLMVYQEAHYSFHFFLYIQTMLVGTCGRDRQHKSLITLLNICVIIFELSDIGCIYFLQYYDTLKCISHCRKVVKIVQPNEPWFQDVMRLSVL